ncbi:MAG: adenylate kinase [Micropruina sp.]|nr:adenylate kinase [Micropruina sp.]
MRMLIMGPPGAGKGTQAGAIAEHYGIPAISTGMIFRLAITDRTALGERIKRVIAQGGYVSDDLTLQVVHARLAQPDAANGWLLDGFPRTVGQVVSLDNDLANDGNKVDAVIALTADEDAVVARLLKRAEIEGREDDNEATIRNRMAVYAAETGPLLDVYRARGVLIEVDGLGSVDEVAERIFTALDAKVGV